MTTIFAAEVETPVESFDDLVVFRSGASIQNLGHQHSGFPIGPVSIDLRSVVDDAVVFGWSSVGSAKERHCRGSGSCWFGLLGRSARSAVRPWELEGRR